MAGIWLSTTSSFVCFEMPKMRPKSHVIMSRSLFCMRIWIWKTIKKPPWSPLQTVSQKETRRSRALSRKCPATPRAGGAVLAVVPSYQQRLGETNANETTTVSGVRCDCNRKLRSVLWCNVKWALQSWAERIVTVTVTGFLSVMSGDQPVISSSYNTVLILSRLRADIMQALLFPDSLSNQIWTAELQEAGMGCCCSRLAAWTNLDPNTGYML